MRRTLAVLLLTGGASLLVAGPAAAQPISEPASCQGYLASYANPNDAFIVHELVMPQDGSVGDVLAPLAQQHNGGIEACIP